MPLMRVTARRRPGLSVSVGIVIVTVFAVVGMTGVTGTGLAHAQDGDQFFCGYDGPTNS